MRDNVSLILGMAVRRRRNSLNLSQEELAHRSRLNRTYITDIERGTRNPSLNTIARLATALESSLSNLFDMVQSFPKNPLRVSESGIEYAQSDNKIVELLLVEDNPDDVDLALLALSKCNLINRVHVTTDGPSALDFIFRSNEYENRPTCEDPHAVLLDLGLPKVSGLEVLQCIRNDPRTKALPVVILTSSPDEEDSTECRRLGVQAYIRKPMDFQQFSLAMPRLGLRWLLLNRQVTTPRRGSLESRALGSGKPRRMST